MGMKSRTEPKPLSSNPRGAAPLSRAREPAGAGEGERERALEIAGRLREMWGHAACELRHDDAYQLLVATILSAQSTDKRVNMVTPELFARYPSAGDLAAAEPEDLEPIIRSTGFYRSKAKNLVGAARALVADHGGEVPRALEELTALPGVARKTANVVLGTAFGVPSGFVVDTHVTRVAGRLDLTRHTRPEKIERDLEALIPRERWIEAGHQLIWHGRYLCTAKTPACERCRLEPLCPSSRL